MRYCVACPRTHEYQSLQMTQGEMLVCPIETDCSLLFLLSSARVACSLMWLLWILSIICFFRGTMDSVSSSTTPRYLKFDTCWRGIRWDVGKEGWRCQWCRVVLWRGDILCWLKTTIFVLSALIEIRLFSHQVWHSCSIFWSWWGHLLMRTKSST